MSMGDERGRTRRAPTDGAPTEADRAAGWAPTVVVAVGTTVANLFGYAVNAIMSRELGVAGFGELASLFAVIVVASVPGTALQAVIARRLSTGDTHERLMRTVVLVAVAVGGLVALLAWPIRAFLDIGSLAPVLWTAATLVPTTVAFGWQGVLQGTGRFLGLSALLVGVQLTRVVGAVAAAATDTGASVALGVNAVVCLVLVIAVAPAIARIAQDAAGVHRPELAREIVRDISPILGVLVLSNLDLLLARHYLSDHESGLYAAGNLVTRAAFWGPAFVVLVAYPRLSVPEQRTAALRRGVRQLAVLSVLGLITSVVAAGLVPVLLGDDYSGVSGRLWLFAGNGLALVGTQFAVFAGLAVHDRRLGRLVWLVAAVECVVVATVFNRSLTQIASVAFVSSGTLVIVATVLEARRPPFVPAT